VPAAVIVTILGVETNYGRITGRYRVLDALTTLAFAYPPRQEFFRSELKQLFLLHESLMPYPTDQLMGSYAGAMGWGQFMPSSVANFARDYDGDGKVDLWTSLPDICASVANYFVRMAGERRHGRGARRRRRRCARSRRPGSSRPIRCSNSTNGATTRRRSSIR
jgi:membrane-bound lytic murein transglycosylase B